MNHTDVITDCARLRIQLSGTRPFNLPLLPYHAPNYVKWSGSHTLQNIPNTIKSCVSSVMNFATIKSSNFAEMLITRESTTVCLAVHHVWRILRRREVLDVSAKDYSWVLVYSFRALEICVISPWHLSLLAPPPLSTTHHPFLPLLTAWAAAINKSISTHWIRFIRLK